MMRLYFLVLVLFFMPSVSSAQLQSLDYLGMEGFRVHQVDLQQVTVVVNLKFYNPNRYGLTLKDGNVDAHFNNNYLGKGIVDEKTKVPARDTFLLPVKITAGLDKVVTNVLGLLGDNTVLVKLDGSIKAGMAGIFIRVPVHYEGEQTINF